MKRLLAPTLWCVLLALPVAHAAEPATAPAKPIVPAAKTELFNGKDLTGWVATPKDDPAKVWTVKDGILTCLGKPNG